MLLYKIFAFSALRPFLVLNAKVSLQSKTEVVKTEPETHDPSGKTRIHGINITQHTPGCYCISVKHTGPFSLRDYEQLDLEIKSARLVKRDS